MAQAICSVEDCDREARVHGWCRKHYERWRANGDPTEKRPPGRSRINDVCSVDGCGKAAKCLNLCPAHYRRTRLGIPLDRPLRRRKPGSTCEVEGCAKKHVANGLCAMHWQRVHKTGEIGSPESTVAPAGSGYINPDGYRIVQHQGRNWQEHRLVMEREKRRPLFSFERVHHKNGIRHDNRPDNLEIWITSHPYGQRPEDLAAWMWEFYPEVVTAVGKAMKRDQRSGQIRLLN